MLDDRVTTLVLSNQSSLIGKSGLSSTALTVTAAAAANILNKKVYSETNYNTVAGGGSASYMDIEIVDRGSAIANFIENATIPGAGTQTKLEILTS